MNDPFEKNSPISCAIPERRWLRATLCLLVLLLLAGGAAAKKKKKALDPNELFNPLLGLEYSHWLVGPIAGIASREEVEAYLALLSDEEAEAFIDEFWAERSSGNSFFGNTPKQIYETRSGAADKRFSEGAHPGSRTDRGTIFILYGEPETIEFRAPKSLDEPTVEVFVYPEDAPPGLDGAKPKREYRFYKEGDLTTFYTGKKLRRNPLDRRRDRFRQ
jgi:GWxTD domain-containing protein